MAAKTYAAILRQRYPFKPPSASVDHVVVGGGVLGLSIGAGLVNTAGKDRTTFVVERRALLGQENTARNSEVIHSGIYYPVGSLKSRLCIRGRDLLYARCAVLDIRHRKTGKLIVATDKHQIPYLDNLSSHTQEGVFSTGGPVSARRPDSVIPAYFLSGDEARHLEPDLSPDVCAALLVTETGIVDSAGLVDSLAREIEEDDYLSSSTAVGVGLAGEGWGWAGGCLPSSPGESEGQEAGGRGEGVVVRGTRVVRIDPNPDGEGWIVQLESGWGGDERGDVEAVQARVVVDAAGLNAASLVNEILPPEERWEMWISKGNYMKYTGPGANVKHLIYPCPAVSLDSLGTHLTFDLDGNIKFGPDVEPLLPATESAQNPDYWEEGRFLAPSAGNLDAIAAAARSYLPGVQAEGLSPDYAGFRPNIRPPGAGFFDFTVRHAPTRKGLVECLGFASPGLTSSLAAGEYVADLVGREVYGKQGRAEEKKKQTSWWPF